MRVARCHARVVSMRGDALHKLTTGLVRACGRIVIEDLNVKVWCATADWPVQSATWASENFGASLRTRCSRRSRTLW